MARKRTAKKPRKSFLRISPVCISATLWAVILWVLIFAEVTIVMFMPALAGLLIEQKLIHLLLLPIMTALCAAMFFNGSKVKPTLGYGLYIGIYFLAVGTVLDLLITVPLFTGFWELYTQWSLWLGFAEGLVACSVVGFWLEKK